MKLLFTLALAQAFVTSIVRAAIFQTEGFTTKKCDVQCTIFAVDGYIIDQVEPEELEDEPEFLCEMNSVYEEGIPGIIYALEGLTDTSNIESGQTTLYSENADCVVGPDSHTGGTIIVQEGNYELNTLPQQIVAATTGERPLLIVYTIPLDHPNDQRTPAEMANEVFGICEGCTPDPANLSSQIEACSGGKMRYVPACSRVTDSCYGDTDIVNGVLEVEINQNIGGVASGTVVNYNNIAADAILSPKGLSLSDFNIFHVFSDQASWGGAAAWAYLPGTVSAYRDTYSYRMGVQVHEIGHNLGFHHSGFGSASYADHSCLMGNPSYGDDGPLICFNGAKSWQSTWYDDDSITVDVVNNNNYDGLLIGVDDYNNGIFTSGSHQVVAKIADSSQSDDYYVMFNRKEGMNGGVTFSADEITVTKGRAFQVSYQQASLAANEEYSINNYGGSGRTLKVKICSIDFVSNSVGPDTARVLIYMDNDLSCETATPAPNPNPTTAPTSSATPAPTLSPTPNPTPAPTSSATPAPTLSPTPNPTPAPSPGGTSSPTPSSNNSDPWLIKNTNIHQDTSLIHISHDINSGPQNAEVQLFLEDCNTPLASNEIVSLSSGPFTYVSDNITYSLFLDENQLDTSSIVTFTNDDESAGTIAFCSQLITKTASNIEVSSKELKFAIDFDMSNVQFTIENVAISEQVAEEINLDIAFSASACECNAQFRCVSEVYTQGDTAPEFRVCITPDSSGVSISNLELSITNGDFVYKPLSIGASGPSPDSLTEVSESETTMMVTTRLVSALFAGQSNELDISGLAVLESGTSKTLDTEFESIDLKIMIEPTPQGSNPEGTGCLDFLRNMFTK